MQVDRLRGNSADQIQGGRLSGSSPFTHPFSLSLHIQVERLRREAADTRLQTEWLEGALADLQEAGGQAPSSVVVLEQQRMVQVGARWRRGDPDCIPKTSKETIALL